jgi:hypothetical protein
MRRSIQPCGLEIHRSATWTEDLTTSRVSEAEEQSPGRARAPSRRPQLLLYSQRLPAATVHVQTCNAVTGLLARGCGRGVHVCRLSLAHATAQLVAYEAASQAETAKPVGGRRPNVVAVTSTVWLTLSRSVMVTRHVRAAMSSVTVLYSLVPRHHQRLFDWWLGSISRRRFCPGLQSDCMHVLELRLNQSFLQT